MSWFPILPPSGESTPVPLDSSVSCGGSPGSSVSCGEPPSGVPSPSGSSGRRWWRAGWGALAVVLACGAVACSGGGGSASSVSVPPYTPDAQTASAGPSAAVSSSSAPSAPVSGAPTGAPTVPGEVTAESLSDPDSDHFVVSIPENLDQTQREVVVAYVAHDRATWRAYRAMDGDYSAVQATTSSDALAKFQNNYTRWTSQGLHMSGVYRVTIQTVDVGGASSDTAVVFTCVDQHDVDLVKADGTSSGKDLQHNYSYMATLNRSSGSWMVVSDERMGADQC